MKNKQREKSENNVVRGSRVDFGGIKAEVIGVITVEKNRQMYRIGWHDEKRGYMTATVSPTLISFENPIENILEAAV